MIKKVLATKVSAPRSITTLICRHIRLTNAAVLPSALCAYGIARREIALRRDCLFCLSFDDGGWQGVDVDRHFAAWERKAACRIWRSGTLDLILNKLRPDSVIISPCERARRDPPYTCSARSHCTMGRVIRQKERKIREEQRLKRTKRATIRRMSPRLYAKAMPGLRN